MEGPIYKLEKVVKAKAEDLEDFEGPLDLILYLLSKNKIEIQDISISLILDQYLAYLEQMEEMDLEVASEFAAMAAHLIYIKTRMLLSINDEEAASEMDFLIQSLEERKRSSNYAKIKETLPQMQAMSERGRDVFVKQPEPLQPDRNYRYVHKREDLLQAMMTLQKRLDRRMPVPVSAFDGIVGKEPYPVSRKVKELMKRIAGEGITRFRALFRGSRSRSEIVATFIAVLELCKAHAIQLAGTELDCTVTVSGTMPERIEELD